MKFFSTNRQSPPVSAREALLRGLAPDGGLYMPESLPKLAGTVVRRGGDSSFVSIALAMLHPYFEDDIELQALASIVEDAFNFPVPLVALDEHTAILELFHGPTCAFKDFGARFLARMVGYWGRGADRQTTVLVATSGDTGSAVAHGFYNVPGTRVILLYPGGKVSTVQEQQMTTLGANITALEIRGTFDDCQALVKQAFLDRELPEELNLTSANSINIGRLLPQSVYYAWGVQSCRQPASTNTTPVTFAVPSGNLGNLTAGVIASRMGVPVEQFVIAVNRNDTVPRFFESGAYIAKPSVQTLSNAMDVGDPNNISRLRALFGDDLKEMRRHLVTFSCSDEETIETIGSIFRRSGYLLDPHAAVGVHGLEEHRKTRAASPAIVLGTAHPAKFSETVIRATGAVPELPQQLASCLTKTKRAIPLSNRYRDFADYLQSVA